jgi:superfamily I DNA and/or RNA helicase
MKRRIEAGKEAYPGFSREQNPYVDYDPEENPWEYSAEDLARGLRLGLFAFRGKPRRMSEKEADDEVAAFRERYKQSKKNYVPYKEMSESEAEENAEKEAGIKRNG